MLSNGTVDVIKVTRSKCEFDRILDQKKVKFDRILDQKKVEFDRILDQKKD